MKIGSVQWFQMTPTFSARGVIETILRLLEQQVITRRKALELIQFATIGRLDTEAQPPPAPWEEQNWAPEAVE